MLLAPASALFRPFEQGDNRPASDNHDTETSGTGLGLAIARNFIDLHGGTLSLRSHPGRGTTVTCLIPNGNVSGSNETQAQPELLPKPNSDAQTAEEKKQIDLRVLLNDEDAKGLID